jgi:hypothetical protein
MKSINNVKFSLETLLTKTEALVLPPVEENSTEVDSKKWLIDKIGKILDLVEDLMPDEAHRCYQEAFETFRLLGKIARSYEKEREINTQLASAIANGKRDNLTKKLEIITMKDTLLNAKLLRRKNTTLNMFQVPTIDIGVNASAFLVLGAQKLPESRMTRMLESYEVIDTRRHTIHVVNEDGESEEVKVNAQVVTRGLKGDPVVYAQLAAEPLSKKDEIGWIKHEYSKKMLEKGIKLDFGEGPVGYEPAIASASQMRQHIVVFVRKDYVIPQKYIDGFVCPDDASDEKKAEFDAFIEKLHSLRGMDALCEMTSSGAYLESYYGKSVAMSTFEARMGTALTSTKTLGNNIKAKEIGNALFPWTDEIEEEYTKYYQSAKDSKGNPLLSDETIAKFVAMIEFNWKNEKVDGQNLITDDAVIRGFAELGVKLSRDEIIGKLVQFRWAGVKGTALVVPRSLLENCMLPDGTHPYSGYDLIVENSSWKYSPHVKYWNGKMTPEFELVALSKEKYSNFFNYQFWAALDGDMNNELSIVENGKSLVDKAFNYGKDIVTNPEIAKAYWGVKSLSENKTEGIGIDDYEDAQTTSMARAIDAFDDIIFDRSFRHKTFNRLIKPRDQMAYGKIPVEGANRFVISDPTVFLRTDLAQPRLKKDGTPEFDYEGNPMFDIVITRMDQVAMRGPVDCYWGDKAGEAVLFRSPCVHPGEPQRVNLVGLDSIPEYIDTAYGRIDTKDLFSRMKNIVVINCFSCILDALGGADTDGDTVLVVTDPLIVELRSLRRAPKLVKVTAEKFKEVMNRENLAKFLIRSLRDNGIGRITDIGTAWRDIELMVYHMPNPKNGEFRLPVSVRDALRDAARSAADLLKKENNLDKVEKRAAEYTARLQTVRINNDETFAEWAQAVINACEANIELARLLQETAINTAKSGIFVELNRYPWFKLRVRAHWHRPNYAGAVYHSWSPMGQIAEYAMQKWTELRTWGSDTSRVLNIGADLDWAAMGPLYDVIRALKAEFGNQQKALTDKYKRKEGEEYESESDKDKARRAEFHDLALEYNQILRAIAVEFGSMDEISAMVYRATNDTDKKTDNGLSFVWSCWGDEFVHSLRHWNSGTVSKRLVAVYMAKGLEDYTLQPGEYAVEHGAIKDIDDPDTILAHSKVPDGIYEIMVFDEKPYLLIEKERKSVESMNADFKDQDIQLIGIGHQIFEGKEIDRPTAIDLLKRGDYTITIKSGISGEDGEDVYINAMAYVNLPELEEPVCIGNLPKGGARKDEAGYFAAALLNKVIRVYIPDNADRLDKKAKTGEVLNRVSLKILEVVEDLSI